MSTVTEGGRHKQACHDAPFLCRHKRLWHVIIWLILNLSNHILVTLSAAYVFAGTGCQQERFSATSANAWCEAFDISADASTTWPLVKLYDRAESRVEIAFVSLTEFVGQ